MDVGIEGGNTPFIAMELLEGEDLGQILRRAGPLPPHAVADYVLQALEAVGQAHALGIVHRDLKPSNLFLATRADGGRTIKVLDFGIAKATAVSRDQQVMTSTQSVMGSPLYMSPEQIRSTKNVDTMGDIWSLGVILYELLSGAPPFNGDSIGALVLAVVEQTPPPVHTLRPGIPPGMSDVVARCLAKDKAQRPTVVELAAQLAPFAPPSAAQIAEQIAATTARIVARSAAQGAQKSWSNLATAATSVAPSGSGSLSGPIPAPSAAPAMTDPPGISGTRQTWGTTAPKPTGAGSRKPTVAMAIAAGTVALLGSGVAISFAVRSHAPPSVVVPDRAAASSAPSAQVAPSDTAPAETPSASAADPIDSAAPAATSVASAAASAAPSSTRPSRGGASGRGGAASTSKPSSTSRPPSSGFSRDRESF
jgi:serine/threonine-protein kinase